LFYYNGNSNICGILSKTDDGYNAGNFRVIKKQIYDAFTDTGKFTQSFSIQELAKGVYYLQIRINGEVMIGKVVEN
jgi:hypothetical protein